MKVKTTRFGEIEVPDETLITFPEGVIGFKDARGFVIFDCGDQGLFKWLQSTDVPELAFVICESHLIVPNYQVVIGQKERDLLELDNTDDAAVCLILVIPEDPQETTGNLLGPIVMNAKTRLGMQMVLVNPEYSTRYKIFKTSEEVSNEEGENAGTE